MDKRIGNMLELKRTDNIDKEYWNIVKGIGIILVVVGHVCFDLTRYIYQFHLPVFFFVSGYLYNEEKYGDDPYLHIANRLKSSWMKYVLVYWVLIWTHNFWVDTYIAFIYRDTYTFTDYILKMVRVLFGQGEETFGMALWFVPTSVISVCLLGFIVSGSRKIYEKTQSNLFKYLFQAVVVVGITIAGYMLEVEQMELHAKVNVSLVIMPYLWVAYLIRNAKIDIKAYLNPVLALIMGVLVYIASTRHMMDLVMMWVYPTMHLVAFMGIYMCLYMAKLFQSIPKVKDVFALYGKASFWIMFMHLPLCRLFDWTYIRLFMNDRFEELYVTIQTVCFPDTFVPVYLFMGLGVSMMIYFGCSKIWQRCTS